ncbi:MAG TPA: PAS domain S-box protein, partial [Sphingobium sp.]
LDTGFPAALVWGEQLTTIYNDGFIAILGNKPEALGRSFASIWEEVWEEIGPIARRAYAGEATFIEDFPLMLHRSGQLEQAWFTFSYSPVRAADGSIAGMIDIVTETTASMLARQAVSESEERYRTVFEVMGEGFCLVELVEQAPGAPIDFLYLDANRAFAEKTGVQDVVGKTIRQVFSGEPAAPFDAYVAVLRTGQPLRVVYSMATQNRLLDVRAFRVGGPGSRRLAVLFEDITEHRAAEEALRRSEQRHRAMLEAKVRERTAELQASRDLLQGTMDASTDLIQVFEAVRDEEGEIVDFCWLLNNHSSENRYGDLRGQRLLERNPGVVEEGIFDTLKEVTTTGQPRQNERHYVHEQYDGWFLQTVVKLNDGVATTSRDISAWKAAQEEVFRLRDEAAQALLRESEERFSRFGEASQDILWMRDAETLQWQYLTPAFETIYGLTREEAMAGDNFQSWLELIVPEDRNVAAENTDRVRGGEHAGFEYRIRRPADGAIRWLRHTDFPIFDEAGKV